MPAGTVRSMPSTARVSPKLFVTPRMTSASPRSDRGGEHLRHVLEDVGLERRRMRRLGRSAPGPAVGARGAGRGAAPVRPTGRLAARARRAGLGDRQRGLRRHHDAGSGEVGGNRRRGRRRPASAVALRRLACAAPFAGRLRGARAARSAPAVGKRDDLRARVTCVRFVRIGVVRHRQGSCHRLQGIKRPAPHGNLRRRVMRIRLMSRNDNGDRALCAFPGRFATMDQARRSVASVNRP